MKRTLVHIFNRCSHTTSSTMAIIQIVSSNYLGNLEPWDSRVWCYRKLCDSFCGHCKPIRPYESSDILISCPFQDFNGTYLTLGACFLGYWGSTIVQGVAAWCSIGSEPSIFPLQEIMMWLGMDVNQIDHSKHVSHQLVPFFILIPIYNLGCWWWRMFQKIKTIYLTIW